MNRNISEEHEDNENNNDYEEFNSDDENTACKIKIIVEEELNDAISGLKE